MKWFDNPRKRRRSPSKRRKSTRRPPKGFRSWKAYMASIRPKGKHMARRKRGKSRKRSSPRRSRRRRARAVSITLRNRPRRSRRRVSFRRRRNPGGGRSSFSPKSILNRAIQGAQDGLWIVGGKAVTNALPNLVGLSQTGALGIGIKALSAVAAGYVFGYISPNAGKLAAAGGFASIYEPILKGMNIPILSPALAADDYDYGSLASYPEEVGSLASYPQVGSPVGVGQEEDLYASMY